MSGFGGNRMGILTKYDGPLVGKMCRCLSCVSSNYSYLKRKATDLKQNTHRDQVGVSNLSRTPPD